MLTVPNDEVRLICLKQMWYIAFVLDQWSVPSQIKPLLNAQYISESTQTQFAEYIINTEEEV